MAPTILKVYALHSGNHVTRLNDLVQHLHISRPSYRLYDDILGGWFQYHVVVEIKGEDKKMEWFNGRVKETKKEAKQDAARRAVKCRT